MLGIERIELEPAQGSGFAVRLPDATVTARRVIVAVGGSSYPGCGTTGDGYAIARRFGHTIVDPRPALVPLRVAADWVPSLKGLSLPDVVASVHSAENEMLAQRREAVLFAHFGLSGPAILDVSRAVARRGESEQLSLQARPGPRAVLATSWTAASRHAAARGAGPWSRSCLASSRAGWPNACCRPRRSLTIEWARICLATNASGLSPRSKGFSLPILGTLGFEKAEVTSGGVALDEVDPKTLESRLVPGLYFAGEILDLDGLIGGYNFQAAWSTGWLAGETAAFKP